MPKVVRKLASAESRIQSGIQGALVVGTDVSKGEKVGYLYRVRGSFTTKAVRQFVKDFTSLVSFVSVGTIISHAKSVRQLAYKLRSQESCQVDFP
jgi:hypothetical protein